MPRFKIACSWVVSGECYVEAPTLEEAIQKASQTEDDVLLPSPFDSDYVDGSLTVDTETSRILNNKES